MHDTMHLLGRMIVEIWRLIFFSFFFLKVEMMVRKSQYVCLNKHDTYIYGYNHRYKFTIYIDLNTCVDIQMDREACMYVCVCAHVYKNAYTHSCIYSL